MTKSADYIVVGGGSAGCVVASRLSEAGDVSVHLLEAGPEDRSLLLRMPLAFRLLRSTMKFDWGYQSEPEPHAGERSIPAARGRVLGGSSSINGMMYSRGHPLDYDEWSSLGAAGWSFEEVLPFFKRSEDSWRGESAWHGVSGPLGVARMPDDDPLCRAMLQTARNLQLPVTSDFEGELAEGFGLPDFTTARGRRASASKAFLDPARSRRNLSITTSARVTRIVIDRSRAVAVEYVHGGQAHRLHANREIIICGGAYASPQILMLSGIGPAAHLKHHGIDVVVDAPRVGQGLQEHPLVPMGFKGKASFEFGKRLRADRLLAGALRWIFTGGGFPATLPLTSVALYRSRADFARPDLETLFMPTNLNSRVWFPGMSKRVDDLMTCLNVVLRPASRGSVELRSADPRAAPVIRFNIVSQRADLDLLRYSIRWTRQILTSRPIADWIGAEAFPGTGVQSDEALEKYIRSTVVTAQHPTSTCAMGSEAEAVVDPSLRVRGVSGLRVADASVMPTLVGGHTNAPAIMIAEKAAGLICAERAAGPGAIRR